MSTYRMSDEDRKALARHIPGANYAREPFGWDANTKALHAAVESIIGPIHARAEAAEKRADAAESVLDRVRALTDPAHGIDGDPLPEWMSVTDIDALLSDDTKETDA